MIISDGKHAFNRAYSLVVSPAPEAGALSKLISSTGLDVSDLRCVFNVKKTLKREPNTAQVEVYNLAGPSRSLLEGASSKLVMRLEAGYKDTGTSQLFLGEVRKAWTRWDGPTCVTTIATGDSEKEMQESRINMSVGPGVSADIALTAIVRALKVSPGNLPQAVATLRANGVANMFGAGTAISGPAADELTEICRSAGLEWSIQDGALQILDVNASLTDKAVELSSDSGLVGSPAIDFQASSKAAAGGLVVRATSFIIPELGPGRKVSFNSKSVKGGFRIEEIEYEGDTHGGPWYAHMLCRRY